MMADVRRKPEECPRCRLLGFAIRRQMLSRQEIARLPRGLRPGPGEKMRRVIYWCAQCKRRWSVIYRVSPAPRPKVRCPRCDSESTRVTSSPSKRINGRRIRHHLCRQCGNRFKSVERDDGKKKTSR